MPDSESTIRKILTEDIKFIITLATVIVSITMSYMALRNDINLINARQDTLAVEIGKIENNHLVHIQEEIIKISEKLTLHIEGK